MGKPVIVYCKWPSGGEGCSLRPKDKGKRQGFERAHDTCHIHASNHLTVNAGPLRGRAEVMRLALSLAQQDWDEKTVDFAGKTGCALRNGPLCGVATPNALPTVLATVLAIQVHFPHHNLCVWETHVHEIRSRAGS